MGWLGRRDSDLQGLFHLADEVDSFGTRDRRPHVTSRKIKRSFTLTPETVAFVDETRLKRAAGSDSEALEMLLREAMLEAKRQKIDAARKEYYDTASEPDLAEQREWAEMTGPNIFSGMPKH
jgi:hypothetical protein